MAALAPTVRRARPAMVAVTCALGCVPALIRSADARPASSLPLVLAFVAAGSAVGWAAEDPGRELLGSLPVRSSTRTVVRIACAALVAVAAVVITTTVFALGPGIVGGPAVRVPEAVAAGALALAVGLRLTRQGEVHPGGVAVTVGLGGTAVVAMVAYRWPALLPSFEPGPVHDRWWAVAALAAGLAAWAARDPGRP